MANCRRTGGIKGRALLKYVWDLAAVWSEEGLLYQGDGENNNNNITGECLQQCYGLALWPAPLPPCLSGTVLLSSPRKELTTFSQGLETYITHWLSDWLTYDFSSTWRYSKDLGWLLCAAHSWHFKLRERKNWRKKEKHERGHKPQVSQRADAHI